MNKEHPDYKNIELETSIEFGKTYVNLKLEVLEKFFQFFALESN